MTDEGPFIKGHPMFERLHTAVKPLLEPWKCVGTTYEGPDTYGGFWFGIKDGMTRQEQKSAIEAIRGLMNEAAGYPAMAKPEWHERYSQDNPYTCPAICLCLMPRAMAERAAAHGGDPMAAALANLREMGVEVRL